MASKIPKLDGQEETEEGEAAERGNWEELPPELLNMIFKHLAIADLLYCSVVSKTWKKASRDVLQRSRECYAYIKHFPKDVHDLIDQIASMGLMQMINGLHIQIRPKNSNANPVPSTWTQEPGCSNIAHLKLKERRRTLKKVTLPAQMRYLTLDMDAKWEENLSLDNVVLLRELISDTSESLQKLVVGQDHCCKFMSSCGKDFAKLKTAHVQYEELLEESFLKEFLTKFAPNLEQITGSKLLLAVNHQGNPFMLERSKSLMVFHDEDNPELFMGDYRCISGLHQLDLQVCHCHSVDIDNILFSMLLKSWNTLEELRIYTQEFYNFFKTSDQLKLTNLRRLNLATNWNMPVENEISILKQLNLPKLCPNLEQVELSIDKGETTCDAYSEEDSTPAALPYGADKSEMPLEIVFEHRGDHYSHEYFEFLNEVYPKIYTVRVMNWQLGYIIYEMSSIFSDIRSLEYLEIIHPYVSRPEPLDFQMDAILCGISSEEAEFLFNSSPRTNAQLNPCIVPIRPSLFNAKKLKELKIIGENRSCAVVMNLSWVIQVTESLPSRHVRNLKVTFEGTDHLFNRLNRLQAFTTLFSGQIIKT